MTEHDFSQLYEQYPTIIVQMEDTFTSHEFILKLAQQNQTQYVEALYTYRYNEHRGTPAPFRVVHMILAQHLNSLPALVVKIRDDAKSTDIFGRKNECAEWRKLN